MRVKLPAWQTLAAKPAFPGVLLALVATVLFVPFLNRAFNIDEPLFLWTAKQIRQHPFDPYGFKVNWYGYEMPMSKVTKNPPLASYYIALASYVMGWSEIGLHLAFLVPFIAAILGTYYLARRLCAHPLLAALITLVTPVFLLCGVTLMCDTLMLAFWVWAAALWLKGLERKSNPLLALSALLIAASALTKYFGMALIPLLLVYSLAKGLTGNKISSPRPQLDFTSTETSSAVPKEEREKASCSETHGGSTPAGFTRWSWLAWLLVPIVILGAYQWVTHSLYGRGLLLDAGAYATKWRWNKGGFSVAKALVGLSYMGGCTLVCLLYSHLLARPPLPSQLLQRRRGNAGAETTLGLQRIRGTWIAGFSVVAALFVIVLAHGKIGAFALTKAQGASPWAVASEFSIFAACGLAIFALATADLLRHRNAESLLLCLWTVGVFVFAAFVNWTINGRSILPLTPAASILLVRRLESVLGLEGGLARMYLPLIPAAAVALVVTAADTAWANSQRTAAFRLTEAYRPNNGILWFQGHWGFQYYMQEKGAKPFDIHEAWIQPRDIVILPLKNSNVHPLPARMFVERDRFVLLPRSWISIADEDVGGGYYADVYGPLPFGFGRVRPDEYLVMAPRVGIR